MMAHLLPSTNPRRALVNKRAKACLVGIAAACMGCSDPSPGPAPISSSDNPPVPVIDAGQEPSNPGSLLLTLRTGEHLAAAANDAQALYLALAVTSQPPACLASGRWVRVLKDGSGATELGPLDAANTCFFDGASGPALALDADALYWVGSDSNRDAHLSSMPKTGGSAKVLWTFPGRSILSLDVDDSNSYLVDGGTYDRSYHDGAVLRVPKTGGGVETLAGNLSDPSVAWVSGQYLVWDAWTNCGGRDEGCSALTFQRMLRAGGSPELLDRVTDTGFNPSTTADGFLYYVYRGVELHRVPVAGGDDQTVDGVATVMPNQVRVSGKDIVVSDVFANLYTNQDRYVLEHFPGGFQTDRDRFNTVDIAEGGIMTSDNAAAYAEIDGAVYRIPFARPTQ